MPLAISPGEDKLGKSKYRRDRENALGKGSSGSWRDTQVDTTHAHVVQHSESPSKAKLGGGHEPPIIMRRRRNGNLKPMRFVSLHHHTTLSYRDGYGLPEADIRRSSPRTPSGTRTSSH